MATVTELGGVVMPKIESAPHLAKIQSIEQSIPNASKGEQARLNYTLGCVAFVMGNVRDKALDAFSQAHALAIELQDRQMEALTLNGLSAAHDYVGLRHDAIREAKEAEQIALELGDETLQVLALQNQGHYCKEVGRHATALDLFRRVRDVGEKLGDRRLLMMGTAGIGRVTAMSQPDVADAYGRQAMVLAEELEDRYAFAVCLFNVTDWYVYRGEYAAALAAYDDLEKICAEIGDRCGVGRSLARRGQIYSLLHEYDRAWAYLNTALPAVLSTGDVEAELHTYLVMAHLYAVKGDIGRACDYYQRTLDKSLLTPDSACANFARRALEELMRGQLPQPGILPPRPINELLAERKTAILLNELEYVFQGYAPNPDRLYPTADRGFAPIMLVDSR